MVHAPKQFFRGLCLCMMVCLCVPSNSQPVKPKTQSYAAGFQYGSIFAHSEAVQNTAGANPFGLELGYFWQRRDSGVVDLCNCYPRKGIVASYVGFDNAVLGRGFTLGWMLEPVYKLSPKIDFSIRGVAGIAYLTNPFDSLKNPTNQSYSTDFSAWLMIGAGLSYTINRKWQVQANANFQHTSNGGLRQPNKGVNYPTFGITTFYAPDPKPFFTGQRVKNKDWKKSPWEKELSIFFSAKRGLNANGSSSRFPIAGLNFQMNKQVGQISILTFGLEGYTDRFTRSRMQEENLENRSDVRIGSLGGHEFLLGKFRFSQQLGLYLFKPAPYDPGWFHRWGVRYNVNHQWVAGINLKAHLQVADFIDFRLAYRW